jgi:hypothetical protein
VSSREDFVTLFGKRVSRESMVTFKRAFEQARGMGETQFRFDGQDVLVTFARYVIEYAENEMGVL